MAEQEQDSAQQPARDERPLNEQYMARLKSRRPIAITMVLGTIVIALASFTDAAGKLMAALHRQRPEDARQELARLSVPFTAADFSAAAGRGDLIVTKLFLVAGMQVDELPDGEAPTALVAAVRDGRLEEVEVLLKAGADPALRANRFRSPVEVAAAYGNVAIATVLLGGKPVGKETMDAAFVAAAPAGKPDMLHFLQTKGADVTSLATKSLIDAVAATRVDAKAMAQTVAILIQAGANIEARSGDSDWTPLHFAAYDSAPEVVGVLLDHGAVPDARDRDGRTPLWFTAGVGHRDAARLLLAKGADANARDKEGTTVLGRAKFNLDESMAQLLRENGAK